MQDQFVPSYVHEIFRALLDLVHVSRVHSPLRGHVAGGQEPVELWLEFLVGSFVHLFRHA